MSLGRYKGSSCTVNDVDLIGKPPEEYGMRHFAEGITRFQREVFPAKAGLLAQLATTHQPSTLFIGCSDARVIPELITQADPGELFVIRTAGNLVPLYTSGADGIVASIEYAIAVLGVKDIIVCGHSACGAMTALAQGHDLTDTPAIADWLRQAAAAQDINAPAGSRQTVAALVRENVAVQLANLATHPRWPMRWPRTVCGCTAGSSTSQLEPLRNSTPGRTAPLWPDPRPRLADPRDHLFRSPHFHGGTD